MRFAPLAPDTDSLRTRRRRARLRLFFSLILLLSGAVLWLGGLHPGPTPTIALHADRRAIGRRGPVEVEVNAAGRGFSAVSAELVQGSNRIALLDESLPTPPGWKIWSHGVIQKKWQLELGKDAQPSLVEGAATLHVTASPAPAWFRSGQPAAAELVLPVRLVPPALEILSSQHYVTQGGSEVVVYRTGATSTRDGVEIGERFFPGFALPGGAPQSRFALFAIPYDVHDASAVHLVAADEVDNRSSLSFVDKFFPLPPKADDIQLDDKFLGKVVPEILSHTPEAPDAGDLLNNYLWINRELRKRNAAELAALAKRSQEKFLWTGPFLALPGGKVMSSFADRRSYVYGGHEVDQQDHLGFDLASISRADVPAANDGVVVLAKYLGIYGNAVVVDHGYGLMSLYAHLSSISTQEGAAVRRGQMIGKSGATGLAGGDHLHFSFLLQGLPVRPVEWWDPHWITDRLKRKLGSALPFAGSGS
ncbi:MAG: M23 family metallopeptidase [Thermoanaerobaculia bacterium]